ncbi:hypothetical protein FBU30_011067 [Linnemannia zychae]|nr:hypothetical protein FBU30_011067 [Linnemannia zychae]
MARNKITCLISISNKIDQLRQLRNFHDGSTYRLGRASGYLTKRHTFCDNFEDVEETATLDEVHLFSPFSDLIKELYHRRYRTVALIEPRTSFLTSTSMVMIQKNEVAYMAQYVPLLSKLHAHAKQLLETRCKVDTIQQKQLL